MKKVTIVVLTFAVSLTLNAQTAKTRPVNKVPAKPSQKPVSQYMREMGQMYLEQVDSATKSMEEAAAEKATVEKMIYGPHSPSTDMDMLYRQRDAADRKRDDAHEELKRITSILESRIELQLTNKSATHSAGDKRLFEILKLLGASSESYDAPKARESGIMAVQIRCHRSAETSIHDGFLYDPTSQQILQRAIKDNQNGAKIDMMTFNDAACTQSDFDNAVLKMSSPTLGN